MAMTTSTPSESAAFLKDMRDKTLMLVEKSLDANMLDPQKFQQGLNKAIGSAANGVVNDAGEIDYNKLDQLMGGLAASKRQEYAMATAMIDHHQNEVSQLFDLTA